MIRSTDAEVRELIAALGSGKPARAEAAVARLSVIGSRAVARLVAAYGEASDSARRLAILRVLEASADERVLPIVRDALAAGGELAAAAVAILRALLERGTPSAQVTALDMLLDLPESPSTGRLVRAAAIEALDAAPDDVRSAIRRQIPPAESAARVVWAEAIEGRLPEDPAALGEALESEGDAAALPILHRLVEAVRAREAAGDSPRRREWRSVRGVLHERLASRGSRIALYDLRETLEAADGPLPGSYLKAVMTVGDSSCLPSLACALSRAPQRELQWRHDLAQAFRTIAVRQRLTARHAAMRRALAMAPELKHA